MTGARRPPAVAGPRRLRREPVERLAAAVADHLRRRGIDVVLSGGACVTLHSEGRYVSADLDFVLRRDVPRAAVAAALEELGFRPEGRVFERPGAVATVDVLAPPPAVGREPIGAVEERRVGRRVLPFLSPTDTVKDRLCAFFRWDDRQALEQAVLVCRAARVDLAEVRRWVRAEGMAARLREFLAALRGGP